MLCSVRAPLPKNADCILALEEACAHSGSFSECPDSQQSAADRMIAYVFSLSDVSWFKGHQPISTQRGVTVSADGRVLLIERAQLSDAGSYRCVATNVAGNAGLQYGLRVNGEWPGL